MQIEPVAPASVHSAHPSSSVAGEAEMMEVDVGSGAVNVDGADVSEDAGVPGRSSPPMAPPPGLTVKVPTGSKVPIVAEPIPTVEDLIQTIGDPNGSEERACQCKAAGFVLYGGPDCALTRVVCSESQFCTTFHQSGRR